MNIENIVNELIANALEWFISVWWYWLPVSVGFLFKYGMPMYRWMEWDRCLKLILKDTAVIFVLTSLWNEISN